MFKSITLALMAMFITFPVFASGYYDDAGIALSKAGVADRQPMHTIHILDPFADHQEIELDRNWCGDDPTPILRQATSLFRSGLLDDEALAELVEVTGWAPMCVVVVFDENNQDLMYSVLLSGGGDFVLGYEHDKPFTPWREIDHIKSKFNAIIVDEMIVLGIAPAGQ